MREPSLWLRSATLAWLLTGAPACEQALGLDSIHTYHTGGASGSGGTTVQGGGGTGGQCTPQCCSPADCPAPPAGTCKQAACNAGVCSFANIPDGMPVGTQIKGDCRTIVCKKGNPNNMSDASDVPDDGNDCTTDTCSGNDPAFNPSPSGTVCKSGGGKLCDGNGKCVECLANPDCGSLVGDVCDPLHNCVPAACVDGMKDGFESDSDCGGPQCSPCANGKNCNTAKDCQSGACGPNGKCVTLSPTGAACAMDSTCQSAHCEQGVCCQTVCNAPCQSCNLGGSKGTCTNVPAGSDPNNSCNAGEKCNAAGACAADIGTPCATGSDCAQGNCADGLCCNAACAGKCESCKLDSSPGTCTPIPAGADPDNECIASMACDGNGGCGKPLGQNCGNDLECGSIHCVDGVCCDKGCNGTCTSCGLSGTLGTCTNIPAGTDPDNECPAVTPNCDGNGACGP